MKKYLLDDYFKFWIETHKKPAVAPVTYMKYLNTHGHIRKYFGKVSLSQITATSYQLALNNYSKTRAKRTVACFHKQIHACLLDAHDEQLIPIVPSRKAIVTGRPLIKHTSKCLNYDEWQCLVKATYNTDNIKEQVVYLSAVTGMRYSEVLGLTWNNIDFKMNRLEVEKTWDYKYHQGFKKTKNDSSKRFIDLDKNTMAMLKRLSLKKEEADENEYDLIFNYTEGKQLYNSNINRFLLKLCGELKIHNISFHSLRHTHASILLYQDVSLMTVSRRLGHSNTSTTQSIYLHIIREMENKEKELIESIMDKVF